MSIIVEILCDILCFRVAAILQFFEQQVHTLLLQFLDFPSESRRWSWASKRGGDSRCRCLGLPSLPVGIGSGIAVDRYKDFDVGAARTIKFFVQADEARVKFKLEHGAPPRRRDSHAQRYHRSWRFQFVVSVGQFDEYWPPRIENVKIFETVLSGFFHSLVPKAFLAFGIATKGQG